MKRLSYIMIIVMAILNLQACYDVAEKENNILSGVYDHMLLCEELTNVELM